MKALCILNYLIIFLPGIFIQEAIAQQKLTLNGAKITLVNGTTLVINNASTDAIVRNAGFIITEGQNNNIKWVTGTSTGTYTVPMGYGSDYIPLIFTKSAGTGNGYFLFSTYHTTWNNSAMLPSGVDNVNRNGIDNSSYTIDRFWKIDAQGYSIKPILTDLTFTYIDAEHTASGNAITESELGAQRWNSTLSDWGDFIPPVVINTTNNTVKIATVSSADLYKWWTLPGLNGNHALPVELTTFTGTCDNGSVQLSWSTASELNNDHFAIERSLDGYSWEIIKNIPGAGNSNRIINYTATDETTTSISYYRLAQTDFNGIIQYSSIIKVQCSDMSPNLTLQVFPNPSTGIFHLEQVPPNGLLEIINPAGTVVFSRETNNLDPNIDLHDLSDGVYFLYLKSPGGNSSKKLMIVH